MEAETDRQKTIKIEDSTSDSSSEEEEEMNIEIKPSKSKIKVNDSAKTRPKRTCSEKQLAALAAGRMKRQENIKNRKPKAD